MESCLTYSELKCRIDRCTIRSCFKIAINATECESFSFPCGVPSPNCGLPHWRHSFPPSEISQCARSSAASAVAALLRHSAGVSCSSKDPHPHVCNVGVCRCCINLHYETWFRGVISRSMTFAWWSLAWALWRALRAVPMAGRTASDGVANRAMHTHWIHFEAAAVRRRTGVLPEMPKRSRCALQHLQTHAGCTHLPTLRTSIQVTAFKTRSESEVSSKEAVISHFFLELCGHEPFELHIESQKHCILANATVRVVQVIVTSFAFERPSTIWDHTYENNKCIWTNRPGRDQDYKIVVSLDAEQENGQPNTGTSTYGEKWWRQEQRRQPG